MRESLEVNSQSPLYSQLVDAILNAIKAGEFKSGDKIPSEEELRKMYGLSRVTVRTAIDSLVEKNILIKKQGKGTFVTVPALESNAQELLGFTDIFSKHGYDLKKEILSVMVIPAPVSCVQDFKIQPNDNVIEVRNFADKRNSDNFGDDIFSCKFQVYSSGRSDPVSVRYPA